MENEYLIKVVTVQVVEGEKDEMEITTTASVQGTSDDYTIKYKEVDSEDNECVTTLRVENGRCINVSRNGEISTHMIIETGVRNISHHITPYGTFSLGINAVAIDSKIDENGGTLYFRYTTDLEMSIMSDICT
mgnify:CR=1 FL=1